MRLGMVGEPSDWLVASHPQDIQATWGPTIVPIDMPELYAAWDDQPQPSPEPLPCEVCRSDWNEAIRMQNALERIVEKRKLDAITVRCFDLLEKRNTTGCLALAKLNDDGVPAACEGDLASAIGMAWVHALLKQPAWMANPASIDQQTNTLLLAHCTVPRSMTTSIGLRTHFESGKGVALAGQWAPSPITLLRVGGCKLEQIWMSEGQILSSGCDENLCRTQVTVRLEGAEVHDLLAYPLGNHLLVIQGHHAKRLRMWWRIFLSNATDTRNEFRAPF
jgi:L-fucose isomerase-like protein